jgi:hypothetical protein
LSNHILDSALDGLRSQFDAGCAQASGQARVELLRTLNQLFRRFRAYRSESDWVRITLDGAASYAQQVVLFSIVNNYAQLLGQTPAGLLPADLSFPVTAAPAFGSAIDTRDLVTALRTPGEVSPYLSNELSEGRAEERAHVLPITNGERVSAILFASDTGADINALELVAGIASSVLERKSNAALHAQISRAEVPSGLPVVTPVTAKPAAWGDLPHDQRQVHIRAQRFARVAVAELQLARPEACRAGREQGDLYLFLKREIDKARENYRRQFMTVPSMVDYLHLELIQNAAAGDEHKLGADYPGRLQ